MGYPLLIRWQYIPRSLTAPDAWLAIFLAAFLQYRQHHRRRQRHHKENSGKFHNIGAKSTPKFNGTWSLGHQWLFTNLRMFVSPLPNQASELNAGMVDLQSDKDLAELANEVALSKDAKKQATKKANVRKLTTSGEMEIRSRRILKGELLCDDYYPLLETNVNLSLAVLVGLASRWMLGLLRSLRLSLASSESISLSGRGGPCCSPYTGGENDHPGSFERILACVLIKKEGDDAGNVLFTLLILVFLMNIMMLVWSVTSNYESNLDPDAGDDDGRVERKGNNADAQIYRRVHPQKIRRVLVGCGAVLTSFWLFHTPVLLRLLGLDGLTEAMEELSARVLLFGNLVGIASLPTSSSLGDIETLKNICLAFLALGWGYLSSVIMMPIEETARNAAHIMSPSPAKKNLNPSEMMDLINVRMMLIIQAVTPVLIMCTYFLNNHFVDSIKESSRGGQRKMTFSKQYLQNSGLYVRIVLAWCFIAACAYCFRSLLQSYLDQATLDASAMGMLGDGSAKDDTSNRRGTSQTACRMTDPFHYRYKNIVLSACHIAAFPALVLGLLGVAHILGGDGSAHPGVGYQSQPLNAPRTSLPGDGLLPSYSNRYMTWAFKQHHLLRAETGTFAGDGLIQAAAFYLSEINESPFRDSAQTTISRWLGNNQFCTPPKVRSVKSLIRQVQFILDETYGEDAVVKSAKTGRELLELAPKVPVTLTDTILRRKSIHGSCESEDPDDISSGQVCETSIDSNPSVQPPSFLDMLVSVASHRFFTPTVVFPIIDTIAFLSSMWWSYWYSFKLVLYYSKLRHLMKH